MGDSLQEILQKNFSHSQFRHPQRDIIESVLSGRDTLAIMPTGGGKSLCYQLPALASDGVTLVVSPLIALMKDQVDALSAKGVKAAMINSSQSGEEQRLALARLRMGELKLAYVSPERFRMRSFTRSLEGVKISLFAVDEAHCISQWGHDFRPDYARLGEALERLGRPTCAAFTATATPYVREDIATRLKLRSPKIFVSGFARENLSFNVTEVSSKAEKYSRIRAMIDKYKIGIIYCATRKSVEALSAELWDDGIRHAIYHGGMSTSERDVAQDAFVSGRENIAVATNAFGMGIDRADIRFVCHYELTGSVEAFYQEAGRAGRDGKPAHCEMLLMYSDKRVQEFFIDGANPEPEYIRAVYAAIRANSDEGNECVLPIDTLSEIAMSHRASMGNRRRYTGASRGASNSMATSGAISILRKMGIIDRFDLSGARTRGTRLLQPDLSARDLPLPVEELAQKRRRDEAKLRDVLNFSYSKECRQQWILRYFGELDAHACSNCDNCRNGFTESVSPLCQLDEKQVELVRKALSGVARMSCRRGSRDWVARFGKGLIVDCLCGAKTARLKDLGFDKLSTYGALSAFGKKFVNALFLAMEEASLVESSEGDYPLLGLTELGAKIMMGDETQVKLAFPQDFALSAMSEKSAKKSGSGKITSAKIAENFGVSQEGDLFKELVVLRDKMRRARKVPAYAIFPNTVLDSLAREKPVDELAAMNIKGIGKAKVVSVLPPFLEIIRRHRA